MLALFIRKNTLFHEVNVSPGTPMYWLVSGDLLRTLMERTGTGASISIRELADKIGVPKSTIGALLTGDQLSVPADIAYDIAAAIGVDVLILWSPVGRAASSVDKVQAVLA
jgi:transcriptional regulator with XRE-family HTH domain